MDHAALFDVVRAAVRLGHSRPSQNLDYLQDEACRVAQFALKQPFQTPGTGVGWLNQEVELFLTVSRLSQGGTHPYLVWCIDQDEQRTLRGCHPTLEAANAQVSELGWAFFEGHEPEPETYLHRTTTPDGLRKVRVVTNHQSRKFWVEVSPQK